MATVERVITDSLTIRIDNQHPIELVDLTRSFLGVADEYRRFVAREEPEASAADLRLFVTEIRSGSITAQLAALAPSLAPLLPLLTDANGIVSFALFLKKVVDFLLGRSQERPNVTKQTYKNIDAIVAPVAKDRAGQININAQNVYLNINSIESNALQNAARRELELLAEPETGEHKQVVLYWYQARNEEGTSPGDKAKIESIWPGPVKVAFADDSIKARMLFDVPNPFLFAYVVDVSVETVNGRCVLYRITALHDKFPLDDSNASGSS